MVIQQCGAEMKANGAACNVRRMKAHVAAKCGERNGVSIMASIMSACISEIHNQLMAA